MLEELKQKVCAASIRLKTTGLITLTWDNVSEIEREKGLIVIKPSGIPYDKMTADDMVVVDLDGNMSEGNRGPSSNLPTHLEIYKAFPTMGGIMHTHSRWAAVMAQSEMAILPLGTTHADAFYGTVPCTRKLTPPRSRGHMKRQWAP